MRHQNPARAGRGLSTDPWLLRQGSVWHDARMRCLQLSPKAQTWRAITANKMRSQIVQKSGLKSRRVSSNTNERGLQSSISKHSTTCSAHARNPSQIPTITPAFALQVSYSRFRNLILPEDARLCIKDMPHLFAARMRFTSQGAGCKIVLTGKEGSRHVSGNQNLTETHASASSGNSWLRGELDYRCTDCGRGNTATKVDLHSS